MIKKNGLITTKLAFNVLARGVSPTLSYSPKNSPPTSPRVTDEPLRQDHTEEEEASKLEHSSMSTADCKMEGSSAEEEKIAP